jgi:glutathione-specific gamma-glutamylcyclotransferase
MAARSVPHELLTAEAAVRDMMSFAATHGVTLRTPDESHALYDDVLAQHADRAGGGDLWIFAYGSLMWNPVFDVKQRLQATVQGYVRSFCLDQPCFRGSPDNPGLMLGIVEGEGACEGAVLAIDNARIHEFLPQFWVREFSTHGYDPRWLDVETPNGARRALAAVVNESSARCCTFDLDERAARIATAKGILGSNREYLFETASHLDELGIHDAEVHALVERVGRMPSPETAKQGG